MMNEAAFTLPQNPTMLSPSGNKRYSISTAAIQTQFVGLGSAAAAARLNMTTGAW